MAESTEKISTIIGPLNFAPDPTASTLSAPPITKKTIDVQCLLCDKLYAFYAEKDDYLAHLYLEHRLVIADEEQVAIFDEYLTYWRERFAGDVAKLPEYCTTMLMDQLPDGTPAKAEKYYLLCDVLPQDNELRRKLHEKRLQSAMTQHQFERTDTSFERVCLYCRDVVGPMRTAYIEHLFSKHFLQLGKSENLVYVDELIETVQDQMDKLICLFCEKEFKDRPTLKEHMRKKGHKRINPDIKSYDRFFLMNYKYEKQCSYGNRTKQKPGAHAKPVKSQPPTSSHDKKHIPAQKPAHKPEQKPTHKPEQKPEQKPAPNPTKPQRQRVRQPKTGNDFESDNSESNWSDWDGEKQVLTCLFCPINETDYDKIKLHIRNEHGVDFDQQTTEFTYYDRVKIVNFVRRQMHILKCLTCGCQFVTSGELQKHLKEQSHYGFGERQQWDLAEYFFPTYEDDAFLYWINDTSDKDFELVVTSGSETSVVLPEDSQIRLNADAEALEKEQLLQF